MADSVLSYKNVSFSYSRKPVLKNFSYDFRPGKLTAICGPNGSGKSTLARLASGMDQPQKGEIRLGSRHVRELPARQRARKMAMLPQSPEAPVDLLVRDLIALGRYAHRQPFSGLSPQDHSAIEAGMAATEIQNFADRPLSSLSGGQRQRAWIAMILAQEAPLLLLDEPTNHLDISHAVETLDLLRDLVKVHGKTAIVILHDINLMASHSDDVVLLKDGCKLRAGAFEDTVSESALSELYEREISFGSISGLKRPFIVVR